MDHCVPLSACGPEFFAEIPAVPICKVSRVLRLSESHANFSSIVQLEEQRVAAKQKIENMLRAAAMFHCKFCQSTAYDPTFVVAIGAKLYPPASVWQPSSPSYVHHYNPRQVLAAIASLDDFRPFGGESEEVPCAHASELDSSEEVHARCKNISREADQYLPGLCLTCVQENREQDCFCEHRDERPLCPGQFD